MSSRTRGVMKSTRRTNQSERNFRGMRVVIQRRRLFYKPDGFYQIDAKEAIDFLLPRHYSGRAPIVSFAFGVYEGGVSSSLHLW